MRPPEQAIQVLPLKRGAEDGQALVGYGTLATAASKVEMFGLNDYEIEGIIEKS